VLNWGCFAPCAGITSVMFREKESVPAMSIAALEKKYHCVIEIKDKNEQSATAGHRRHAGIIIIIIIILFLIIKIIFKPW